MHALIVDDSRAIRAALRRIVGELGFEALEAGNGREALERLAEGPTPQVALVDWNMPEMNGLEFVVAARGEPPYQEMPIVMVTTETEMAQVSRALEAGADEYIMKPFTAAVLREKLSILGLVSGS